MKTKNIAKKYYDKMGGDYLGCWRSPAKKNIHKFEIDFVNKNIESLTKDRKPFKILEIGVGPGRIAKEILSHDNDNIEYYGLDISEEMIKVFRKEIGENNKIKQLSVFDIGTEDPFPNIKFDCIVAVRTIYYNKNWRDVIRKLSNMLSSNGGIVFCMLNRNSTAIFGKALKSDLVGYYVTRNQIISSLKMSKIDDIKITGYARMPDIIYDLCRNELSANILFLFEKIIRLLLGKNLFSRMFYVVAKKKENYD